MSDMIADLLRVPVYVLGGFILVTSFVVSVQHFQQWRSAPGNRLMPLHIALIALSYDLLVITLLSRTDQQPTWRIFVYAPALAIGAYALFVMLRYQSSEKRRVR